MSLRRFFRLIQFYASGRLSKTERGFSLIEVMMAVGILGVLILGLMTTISSMNKNVQTINEKMSLQETQFLMTNVLSSATFCGCFFSGHTFNASTHAWAPPLTTIASS